MFEYSHLAGFLKAFKNLQLFYIMNAGHMVPADNSQMALKMMQMVVNGTAH